MTFAVNWKKIIIIRYSYPTGSMKITTKDIATVPYGPSVITFCLYVLYKKNFWESYREVNAVFCEEISRIVEPNDWVWGTGLSVNAVARHAP